MKKRMLACAAAAAMTLSCLPAAGAAVATSEAGAYLDAIDSRPGASSYLVDFDGDGTDELVLLWQENGTGENQYCEVWNGSDRVFEGKRQYLYWRIMTRADQPGKYYLVDLFDMLSYGANLCAFTLEDGRFALKDTTYLSYDYSDEQEKGNVFEVNGKPCTEQEVLAAFHRYQVASWFQDSSDVRSQVLAAANSGGKQPSSWAQAEIEDAGGYEMFDKLYGSPDWQDTITRRQFAWLIVQMLQNHLDEVLPGSPSTTFSDCSDEFVRHAYGAGIVSGTSATTFSPEEKLTREQLAAMLWRAAAYVEQRTGKTLSPGGTLDGYSDAGQVSAYARDAIAALTKHGILAGTSQTTLSPKDGCTVEQSLVLIHRMLKKL